MRGVKFTSYSSDDHVLSGVRPRRPVTVDLDEVGGTSVASRTRDRTSPPSYTDGGGTFRVYLSTSPFEFSVPFNYEVPSNSKVESLSNSCFLGRQDRWCEVGRRRVSEVC